jgi:hypothetical protein
MILMDFLANKKVASIGLEFAFPPNSLDGCLNLKQAYMRLCLIKESL